MWGHSSARTDQITSLFHDRIPGPLDRWRGGVVHRRTSAIPGSRRGSEVAPALLFHASSLSRRELGPKQHTNGDPRYCGPLGQDSVHVQREDLQEMYFARKMWAIPGASRNRSPLLVRMHPTYGCAGRGRKSKRCKDHCAMKRSRSGCGAKIRKISSLCEALVRPFATTYLSIRSFATVTLPE